MSARSIIQQRPSQSGLLIALLSAFVLLSLLSGSALAAPSFDEGIEYKRVAEPQRLEPGDDVEVLELFWYGCPHCYQLEPAIERWLENKPEGVSFRRLPAAASSRWIPHAKAYFAAEQLGELEKLHEPLFKALHEQRRRIFTDEELFAFAAEQGIDEQAFRDAYQSFPVDMRVRQSADLARRYQLSGVPAIVVNGTYITGVTEAGGRDQLFELVDVLVAKEQAAGD
ncbi:MAG: thiol:disulfide interchange protein DsbA/DsbL [Chromatiaceae bacterium]|nr:thiol:disulfide interchange protein DsbA/DsbL [Chromatiaceae bacterium]MCF7993745.1 thiol:disulfide interchange protein DsbA/DsbL [Chromatiaceae bacterium]MCF8003917.1 thiol:disulfide interchange protein DsbA/DsbL [Chromatiaceae bacterium]MCF8014450.1 thiol:disulfide interchange protein DsbA/DsbL [Chromatiaceae bacterium]